MLTLNVSMYSVGLPGTVAKPSGSATTAGQLTPAQQHQVEQLKQIDQHVRDHEQAHLRAAHGIVNSGPSYSYTYGPDGKAYATGGEVGIDTGAETKPQANIDKGRQIQAAALAPSDPSPQDYRVASAGAQLESRGHTDLVKEQRQERATKAASGQPEQSPVPQDTAQTRVSQAYSGAILATSRGSSLNIYA
jgi:hypothetical protein